MRATDRARAPLIALALLCAPACNNLTQPTQPCATADDCPLPLVCCTGGFYLSLNDFTGPTCGVRYECAGDFLPFLPEDAPCARAPLVAGESCKAGLTCCNRTLTCTTEATCAAAPLPPDVEPPQSVACFADVDCPASTVCCGIDYSHRDGTCTSLAACAGTQGVDVPHPDAGPAPAMDASVITLSADICDAAYCDASGPRAPTAMERASCIAAFDGGGELLPTEACLDAVRASRPYCGAILRPRDAQPSGLPVLPAACRLAAIPADADATAACEALSRCDLLGGNTIATCASHLAGLGYDNLSRLAEQPTCTWPAARLGWAPKQITSRCRVDADCPDTFGCEAADSSHGICVRVCGSDADCGDGRCLQRHCYATCAPLQESDRAAIERGCNARIVLDGPPELGCVSTVAGGGIAIGACAAVPPIGACPNGPEPIHAGMSTLRAHGYGCADAPGGTLPRQSACLPDNGVDPCAEGACIPDFRYCSDPCVASPFAPDTCRAGEICVADRGWGLVGGCMISCANTACPAGARCLDTAYGRACQPL